MRTLFAVAFRCHLGRDYRWATTALKTLLKICEENMSYFSLMIVVLFYTSSTILKSAEHKRHFIQTAESISQSNFPCT